MDLDAQSLRRALYDFFKFNPKDFYIQASGSSYLVSAIKQNPNSFVQPPGPVNLYVIEQYLSGQGGTNQQIFPANLPSMVAAISSVETTADSTTQTLFASALAAGVYTNGSTFANAPFQLTKKSSKTIVAFYASTIPDEYIASTDSITGVPATEIKYRLRILVFADVIPVKITIGYKWEKIVTLSPYSGGGSTNTTTLTDTTFDVSIFGYGGQPVDIPNPPDIVTETWPSVTIPPIGIVAPLGISSVSRTEYRLTITSLAKSSP